MQKTMFTDKIASNETQEEYFTIVDKVIKEQKNKALKKEKVLISKISNSLGVWIVGATSKGICMLQSSEKKILKEQLKRLIKYHNAYLEKGTSSYFAQIEKEFNEYIEGKRKDFEVPIDTKGTAFQESVWETLCKIPYGTTVSYKEEAELLGNSKAIRAVANANAVNRIAIIIPCHRVIGHDGSLVGYGGKLWRKQHFIELERKN